MEVVGSIASEIAKDLYSKTKRQARYVFCFNNIVEDFKQEKKKLIPTQASVHERAINAKNNTEKIEHVVQKWLEDADSHIEEAEKLEKETEIKRKCLFAWCPDCIRQYRLGRKLVKKTQKLTKLNATSQFNIFSLLATLPGMEYHASDDFVCFESRKAAYEQLMESLTKGERFRVGLYGMGGSGKTNLVTEVGKQAEKSKLFDKVIFVVVSTTPDIRIIQGNIASSLGLKLEEEQEPERARRLWLRLTNGEKILIILDDVWEKLDFKAVGIPYDSNHKNCRVLLTTRNLEVCNEMDCQEAIELSLLTVDESWNLFKQHAGIDEDSSNVLKNVALEITNECRGLPIAIAAVASTLKNKPLDDWKEALETLRHPKSLEDVDDNFKKVYACLRLSYDNLKNEKAKSLFLLCSSFPEDYNIDVEDLTRFGIGLGLFGEVNSYRRARSQVVATKNKLIESCLLLEAKEGQCVKMHDLVRDVALWIANKEIQVIRGSNIDHNVLTKNVIVRETTITYLQCREMRGFPNILNSSKLEILLVDRDEGYHKKVPDEFFGGMKELRVLILMNRNLSGCDYRPSLPQSIQLLTNLRTLRLKAWRLGELSVLKNFERLETLELYSCEMDELPSEIIQLKCLKLLFLSNCKFGKNPYEVIGRCSQLEELGVFNVVTSDACEWWDREEMSKNFFVQDGSFPTLQRYSIEIGGNSGLKNAMGKLISKGLSIGCFEAWTSNKAVKDLVRRAEILHLQGIQRGYRTFSPDIVEAIGGMNQFVQLKLDFCSHIECLMDSTKTNLLSSAIFSKLVKLEIKDLDHLEELCRGPPGYSFQNLETLNINGCIKLNNIFGEKLNLCRLKVMQVSGCPMLTFLFTPSVARSLVLLERLEIRGCKKLEYIFPDDQIKEINEGEHEIRQDENDESDTLLDFDSVTRDQDPVASTELQAWQGKNTKWPLMPLHTAQCLSRQSSELFNIKFMELNNCSNLTSLFTVSTAQRVLLENLVISGCPRLEFIITDDMEDHHAHENHGSIFPLLTRLHVINCKILKFIFPVTFSNKGFTKLYFIKIEEAPELKYVLGQYLREDQMSYQNQNQIHIDFPALYMLFLDDLPNIISFCPENVHLRCPSLNGLDVGRCPRLSMSFISCFTGFLEATQVDVDPTNPKESLHTATHATSLPNVILRDCNIEGIFQLEELPINAAPPLASKLSDMVLFNLPELSYICKGPIQVLSLQCLKLLIVEGCNKLRAIFSASILRSLPQLQELFIRNCEQLEQINEDSELEDQIWLNNGSQPVCFPNLKGLMVQHCNNLLRLFSFSSTHELRKLDLTMDKASELENFFYLKGDLTLQTETYAEEGKQIFELQAKLPSIPEPREGFKWQTKKACVVYVHGCPKLNLTTTATPADTENEIEENPLELGSLQNVKPNSDCRIKEIINENPAPEFTSNLPKAPEHPNSEGIQATPKSGLPSSQANTNQIMSETKRRQESQTQESISSITPQAQVIEEEKSSPVDSSMLTERTREITITEGVRNDIPASENPTMAASLIDSQAECDENKLTTETPKQADMPLNHAHDVMELADDSSSKASALENLQLSSHSPTPQSPTSMDESSSNVDIPTSVRAPPLAPLVCASTEDLVDFRGLFKIDGRRASLLNEALSKYPHLWEWRNRFRPKYCNWGYESLADMLLFLTSETPKAMNESRRKEFRKLHAELESFGFEEGWLASIYGRVMEVQVDDEKLKELAELESQEIALLDELNNLRSKLCRIRDDLSKYDTAFGF